MTKLVKEHPRMSLRRQYGFFDDFDVLPPRQTHTYLLADLAANADLAATVLFSPTVPVLIHDVSITPDGSSAGVDGSNTSLWTVTDGSNTIVTQTYDGTPAFPAENVQTSLGSITFGYVATGGRIELAVTNGTTADLPPCVVTVTYSDADAYPPGWKVVASDDGTTTMSDGRPTVLALTASDTAADNDEIYCFRQHEDFDILDDKPLVFEARAQWAEANTDDANVIVGLKDAWAADSLVDDSGGPPSSYSGAVFYKVDGGTAWVVQSSVGTSQTTNTTDVTAPNGASDFHTLRIEIKPSLSTDAEVTFWIDENGGNNFVQCRDATTGKPIVHTITHASVTDMAAGFGVKNGGANTETLNVDYCGAEQLR